MKLLTAYHRSCRTWQPRRGGERGHQKTVAELSDPCERMERLRCERTSHAVRSVPSGVGVAGCPGPARVVAVRPDPGARGQYGADPACRDRPEAGLRRGG